MSEKRMQAQELGGVTFQGDVTFQGPMFDIHDNEHVHIGQTEKQDGSSDEGVGATQGSSEAHADEKLSFLVHPSVDDEREQWRIHNEVKRLVGRQGLQEICQYLQQMRKENKILLPMNPSVAYQELVRLGMPTGKGFNESTFRNSYSNR